MADTYLNIAEAVLLETRRPMRPREIIEHALLGELLPYHLHGPRQDRTLQARLSEDLATNPERSRFFRTSPGTFFLCSLAEQSDTPAEHKIRHLAQPRIMGLRRDNVLLLKLEGDLQPRTDGAAVSISKITDALDSGLFDYGDPLGGRADPHRYAVHSFVVVFRRGEVLSFRSGKYFPREDPLFGNRSIGFGGSVYRHDVDMLYENLYGIVGSGINELRYGIGLTNIYSERARYENQLRPYIGVLSNGHNLKPNVLHIILGFPCPEDFNPTKTALSINDLRWISASNPSNNLDDFDGTSRYLLLQDHVRELMRMLRS